MGRRRPFVSLPRGRERPARVPRRRKGKRKVSFTKPAVYYGPLYFDEAGGAQRAFFLALLVDTEHTP